MKLDPQDFAGHLYLGTILLLAGPRRHRRRGPVPAVPRSDEPRARRVGHQAGGALHPPGIPPGRRGAPVEGPRRLKWLEHPGPVRSHSETEGSGAPEGTKAGNHPGEGRGKASMSASDVDHPTDNRNTGRRRRPWLVARRRLERLGRARRVPSGRRRRLGPSRAGQARPQRPRSRRTRCGEADGRDPVLSVDSGDTQSNLSNQVGVPAGQGLLVGHPVAIGQGGDGRTEAHRRTHVLEPGPPGTLLLAAYQKRVDAEARGALSGADAGRPAQLVGRHRDQVGVERPEIEWDVSGGGDRVDMDGTGTSRCRHRSIASCTGCTVPDLVVGPLAVHERRRLARLASELDGVGDASGSIRPHIHRNLDHRSRPSRRVTDGGVLARPSRPSSPAGPALLPTRRH